MKTKFSSVLLLFFLCAIPCFADQRIVAIGDIHGAVDEFITILQKAELINQQKNWTGKNAILVQTGDILDRGPDGRAAMDLLMSLQQQASRTGGRIHALLGNHEMMNLVGDLRYVTAEDYAKYAGADSEKKRDAAYQNLLEFKKRRAKVMNLAEPVAPDRNEWNNAHPLGFFEHRDAFAPNGKYGKWLRQCEPVVKVSAIVFLHGGISPAVSQFSIEQVNRRSKDEIGLFDEFKQRLINEKIILPFFTFEEMFTAVNEELQFRKKSGSQDLKLLQDFLNMSGWLTMAKDGPLWFRGYAEWSDVEGPPQVDALLQKYEAKQFVVGHTVRKDGTIQSRFNNRVFLIDTGMNRNYVSTGQPSALEIQDGAYTAIYRNKRVALNRATQQ